MPIPVGLDLPHLPEAHIGVDAVADESAWIQTIFDRLEKRAQIVEPLESS